MLKTNIITAVLLACACGLQLHAARTFTQTDEVSDAYINKRVSEKIIAELERKPAIKPVKHTNDDIYLLPNWPFYSVFFEDNDLVQLSFNFETASKAYSGEGDSQDLSKLIFGEQMITIGDILLASKLVNLGIVTDANLCPNGAGGIAAGARSYFDILANQPVIFDADMHQETFAFDYARHFYKKLITTGFHLPLILRHQRLHLTNDITVANRNLLASFNSSVAPLGSSITFFQKAGYNDLEDFLTAILSAKGIAFNKKENIFGLGDITGYINFDVKSHLADRFVTGFSVLFPTAERWDTRKLWDPGLGNGGFFEAAWYGSMLWQVNRWFNPHVHLKTTYSFESNVWRRVPMVNTWDGTSFNGVNLGGNYSAKNLLVLGSSLTLNPAQPFSLPDSTVRGFADQAIKVKINRGPEFFCRLGNTFDSVFGYKGFLDIYYDLYIKGKDYVHNDKKGFIGSIWGHNSQSIAHTLGANYSYQFDKTWRMRAGMSYVIAGSNTPKTFGIDLGLNAEF